MTTPHQSASLYVGDLLEDVNENVLFDTFREVGPVLSIRVCRDAVTRKSLGYAYVNFQNPYDAERTIEALNYIKIRGKPCRIMWSHRDPSLRKAGRGNIFIKNLDPSIDNKALYDTFSAFGNILSCKVKMTDDGKSAGYGFVHFETEDSATAAIEKVNGMLLNGKQVYVGFFIRKAQRNTADIEETFTNLYIKYLDASVNKDTLEAQFAKFGPIVSAAVMASTDENGNVKSKGFGFVNFEKHESAKKAVEELHGKELSGLTAEGKQLYVQRAQNKAERQAIHTEAARKRAAQLARYVNLYVKNIDDSVDDDKLRETFGAYGKIISCKIMRDDQTRLSRGFGFVCFEDHEAANKAVQELNNHIVLGVKPLYVAVAQRKEARRAALEQQFSQRLRGGGYPPGMQQQQQASMQQPSFPNMYAPNLFYPAGGPAPPQAVAMQQQMGQFMGYPQQPVAPGPAAGVMGGRPMQPRWVQGAPVAGMPGMPQFAQQAAAPRPAGNRVAGSRLPQQRQPGPQVPQQQQQQQQQQPGMGGNLRGMPQQAQQQGPPGSRIGGGKVAATTVLPGNHQQINYSKNVRNLPATQGLQQPVPQPQAIPIMQQTIPGPTGQEPLTAAALANMTEEQAKNALGERLFVRISETHPNQAAKVTGMLLELDNTELLNLLESPEVLNGKIAEATAILESSVQEGQI